MELSRRSFLGGVLCVAAVSVVPIVLGGVDLPVLYGDGVHDDTVALRAALNGEPFIADGHIIKGTQSVALSGGVYRLSDEIVVRGGVDLRITAVVLNARHPGSILVLNKPSSCYMENVTFNSDGCSAAIYAPETLSGHTASFFEGGVA